MDYRNSPAFAQTLSTVSPLPTLRKSSGLVAGILCSLLPAARTGAAADAARPACSVKIAGALVIVGGGGLPDEIRDRFLELAGRKRARLVIIPTASDKADQPGLWISYPYWKAQNVASVAVLHTRSREQANDPAFVKPLLEATGVWLSGGDQARLTAAYRGTLVEKELQKLLARGGVIGGTSAGAAVMSPVMILGGNPSARTGTGFGFLPGVVIDQHFQNRHRLDRLLGVLEKHPTYYGIGIDEQTAIVVHGSAATVLGQANVRVCLPPSEKHRADVQVLKAGEQVDLSTLGQIKAATRAEAREGQPGVAAERVPAAP